jgi:hypothetical protein
VGFGVLCLLGEGHGAPKRLTAILERPVESGPCSHWSLIYPGVRS